MSTYSQAKGRSVSHRAFYVTKGNAVLENGRLVIKGEEDTIGKKKAKDKTKKQTASPHLPRIRGVIPNGFVFKSALILSIEGKGYAVICSYGNKPNMTHPVFIGVKPKQTGKNRETDIAKRIELLSIASKMMIGNLVVGESMWEDLFSEAKRIMKPSNRNANTAIAKLPSKAIGTANYLFSKSVGLQENIDNKPVLCIQGNSLLL